MVVTFYCPHFLTYSRTHSPHNSVQILLFDNGCGRKQCAAGRAEGGADCHPALGADVARDVPGFSGNVIMS